LAARSGLSVRGLSDLERGVRAIPRKDTLRLLVEALELTGSERAALVIAAKRRPAPPLHRAPYVSIARDLPVPLTPLVGRADQVATVCAQLGRGDVRLLTLTGPGGVGKTRLALHIAQEIGPSFADGGRFVDLSTIRDPALVVTTIAQALALREMGGRPLVERLAALLRDKQMLLVLDNFEHVVEAALFVTDLLGTCAGLKALVTSRTRLRVTGEHEHVVPPLTVAAYGEPRTEDVMLEPEAVQLFVERAHAVNEDFVLIPENASIIFDICRRLDGLPLAIELAAARVKVLPPSALLSRLERRLPLLRGGVRDAPARQQTMHGAIAWSYDLLAPDEQQLFRRLAVFAGGCTLEAVETVCSDGQTIDAVLSHAVLDGLASLVDKSLVWQDAHGHEPRYRMLETIREYGLERLAASGEAEVVRRRHVVWCQTLAEQSYAAIRRGPEQRPWLERTEVEHDNVRAALTWLLEEGDAEAMQRLATALHPFWYVRGYLSEGRTWLERTLIENRLTPAPVQAGAKLAAGWLAWVQGDYAQAEAWLHDSLEAFRALGHTHGVAEGLHILGMVATDRGDFVQATTLLTEALDLFRTLGDTLWIGFLLNALGIVAYEQGKPERAAPLFTEALAQFRTMGETNGTVYALTNLGKIALARGDIDQAATYYRERLALWKEHGEEMSVAGCFRGLAIIAAAIGKCEEAARLFGAAEALRERIGVPQARHRARYEQAVNHCRADLGEERMLALWHDGRQMRLETAVAIGMGVMGTR